MQGISECWFYILQLYYIHWLALVIFSFKYEGEIKSFTDKQKLREFSTTKPVLQQILKDIL